MAVGGYSPTAISPDILTKEENIMIDPGGGHYNTRITSPKRSKSGDIVTLLLGYAILGVIVSGLLMLAMH